MVKQGFQLLGLLYSDHCTTLVLQLDGMQGSATPITFFTALGWSHSVGYVEGAYLLFPHPVSPSSNHLQRGFKPLAPQLAAKREKKDWEQLDRETLEKRVGQRQSTPLSGPSSSLGSSRSCPVSLKLLLKARPAGSRI